MIRIFHSDCAYRFHHSRISTICTSSTPVLGAVSVIFLLSPYNAARRTPLFSVLRAANLPCQYRLINLRFCILTIVKEVFRAYHVHCSVLAQVSQQVRICFSLLFYVCLTTSFANTFVPFDCLVRHKISAHAPLCAYLGIGSNSSCC